MVSTEMTREIEFKHQKKSWTVNCSLVHFSQSPSLYYNPIHFSLILSISIVNLKALKQAKPSQAPFFSGVFQALPILATLFLSLARPTFCKVTTRTKLITKSTRYSTVYLNFLALCRLLSRSSLHYQYRTFLSVCLPNQVILPLLLPWIVWMRSAYMHIMEFMGLLPPLPLTSPYISRVMGRFVLHPVSPHYWYLRQAFMFLVFSNWLYRRIILRKPLRY